jgi:glycosyltransferase involved in cell wall biosynthesis
MIDEPKSIEAINGYCMDIGEKKILHYISGISKPIGGIEKLILNCCTGLEKAGFSIEILTRYFDSDSESYRMLLEAGIRIFTLDIEHLTPETMFIFYKRTKTFFSNHASEYYAIHSHDGQDPFVIACARHFGIKQSIVHVHSYLPKETLFKSFPKKVNIFLNSLRSKHLLACSQDVGKATFWSLLNKKMRVIHNGVDLSVFEYNPGIRRRIRNALSITNELVVGHVGRFHPSKNHQFILKIFCELIRKEPNAKLLLVGNGELFCTINNIVKQIGIQKQVIFLGDRRDVADLMQAMDVFLFPSTKEGFGMAVIEAQAAGLPCVVSKGVIPRSAFITELVVAVDLSSPVTEWSEAIKKLWTTKRSSTIHQIKQSGYDVSTTVSQLIEVYEK